LRDVIGRSRLTAAVCGSFRPASSVCAIIARKVERIQADPGTDRAHPVGTVWHMIAIESNI
jgi:hypothetical protein